MTTARDIITAALEDVGVVGLGQTATGEDMNFGLVRLNRMIAQFNRRRWLIFHLKDVVCTSTGSNRYSVGIGGDFNVPRPDKIETGSYFQASSGTIGSGDDFSNDESNDFGPVATTVGPAVVHYPLRLVEARETWNQITLPNLTSWPSDIFYDAAMNLGPQGPAGQPGNPLGTLHIYPVPAVGQFDIHLLVKDVLSTYATPATVLSTPPEYEEAFEYNLALRFCAKYQIEASKEITGLARASLATIRSANTQIPLLRMPRALVGRGMRYNAFSDNFR